MKNNLTHIYGSISAVSITSISVLDVVFATIDVVSVVFGIIFIFEINITSFAIFTLNDDILGYKEKLNSSEKFMLYQ
ncbi:9115_t:CDS:2 [Funneliformis mosseae]|uniref:9115_t:CDS:1 n=1 Tax=Funneliformis mosseae TaxID=27381 RepID=A0A9N9ASL0_FUNMO|nr:9115_t:CDS:2 [Funneliformis mosseae]